MEDSVFHQYRRKAVRQAVTVTFVGAAALGLGPASAGIVATGGLPAPIPAVSDYQFLSGSVTPPTEAACFSAGRRCFTPTTMQASYNLGDLYKANRKGQGMTIAIIDSFGDPNMASDLGNFNTQMGSRTCAASRA
jgi:subtilase family serine protease